MLGEQGLGHEHSSSETGTISFNVSALPYHHAKISACWLFVDQPGSVRTHLQISTVVLIEVGILIVQIVH